MIHNIITIPQLDTHETTDKKVAKLRDVGKRMTADADPDIAAQGALLTGEATTLEGLQAAHISASKAAIVATHDVNVEAKTAHRVYGAGIAELTKKHPGAKIKWLSYDVNTTDQAEAAVVPAKVIGGSAVQSSFAGKANMQFHHAKGAIYYKIMETIGDSHDPTTYYPVNPSTFDNSKGGEVIPKHLGVLTSWVVISHNKAGDGAPTDPLSNTIH